MNKAFFLSLLVMFSSLVTAQQTNDPDGDYTELTDTKPYDSKEIWESQKAPVQLQWGSTDIRYSKLSIPKVLAGKKISEKAWKGERVNTQAVLWSNKPLKNITLTVSDLKNGSSVIPSSAITPGFVRYVMTDELNKDGKGACGHRPDKTQWDSSMVADVLDAKKRHDIEARNTQPLWFNIWVPQDIRAGKYQGTLTVSADGLSPMSLQLEIDVLNHTLPAPKDWKYHLDLWQNPYAVARLYNVPLWSEAHFDKMRPVMARLASAGQKVITASIMHRPWAGQTEDHFDSMIGKIKKLDGSWEYDYTVFDKWIEFMISMGIDQQINCFTLVPWALKFDYYDQATNRIQFVETKPGEPAYEDYWYTFLKDFSRHLKQKGWFERTTISMDEREMDMMKHALDLIFKADPEYKVSSQGNYYAEIEPLIYDFCLAYGHNVPDDVRARRQQAGKITTVYNCCSEARPNVFTFSPPAEAAWMIWHSVAGEYDGYLRWAYNSWVKDPLHDSRFRTWAAGDCYMVYPGRSSIRMERLIEGVQDAEKIRILREEFKAKGMKSKLEKLNKAISEFSTDKLTDSNAAQMLNAGRKVLNSF